jgi:hypothetical protein
MYNKRTWLNKENSPSTGNIVAYDGETTWKGESIRSTVLSISDCYNSVRLHKNEDDTINDFIDKMELLKTEIDEFIKYLRMNYD